MIFRTGARMLIVRSAQVAQFGDGAREGQKERLLAYLKEHYPDACAKVAGQDLRAFIGDSQVSANESGRHRDKSVFPFVEALFTEKWIEPEAPPMSASQSLRPPEQ